MVIVQLPPGISLGTVAVGTAGARNVVWYAAAILALIDPGLAQAVADGWATMTEVCPRPTPK